MRFEVVVPGVEEIEQGDPAEVARENARRKALAVEGQLVLGVDTIVTLDGHIYGKPADRVDAERTLRALSGRTHTVISGVCVVEDGREGSALAQTGVRFRKLEDRLLDWYLETGEWRDRAGAYAIQGCGAALVDAINGDYSNVVGLPVPALLEMVPTLLGG